MSSDGIGDVSNPDRRNLNLISLIIIVYFIAGGQLTSDVITLQFVDIKFSNIPALITVLWVLFAWYWLRFHISNESCIFAHFNDALSRYAFENESWFLFNRYPEVFTGDIEYISLRPSSRVISDKIHNRWTIPCKIKYKQNPNVEAASVKVSYYSADSLQFIISCIWSDETFANVLLPHILAITTLIITFSHLFLM